MQTRYIVITGGVVSSLGKGLTAASLGALFEARGLRVELKKLNPYLNTDPGTMSPHQHGEVFVLDDGSETDLDLGHYERFTQAVLTAEHSQSSGKFYRHLLDEERKGSYLGQTVQIIPHLTDAIKAKIGQVKPSTDICIIELGGTIGDIEGQPFVEAIRQFRQNLGDRRVAHVHMTFVPYLKAAGELKSKPTQQSVAKLREMGVSPDMIICRTEHPLPEDLRKKISLFCGVKLEAVIEEMDVPHSIYELPALLAQKGADSQLLQQLRVKSRKAPDIASWKGIAAHFAKTDLPEITIALVGKYMEVDDAYKSVTEALAHAGIPNKVKVRVKKVDSEMVEKEGAAKLLKGCRGILVPGGFGNRGIEGKILACQYARTRKIPYFGICLGLQIAVIEHARNVVGLKDATSLEFDSKAKTPVISLMEEQKARKNLGGTMRLGRYDCRLRRASKAYAAYKQDTIAERHRHRFEVSSEYADTLFTKGLRLTGVNEALELPEIVEQFNHPWFVGVQFHPEFLSKPLAPHPLFREFIAAAKA